MNLPQLWWILQPVIFCILIGGGSAPGEGEAPRGLGVAVGMGRGPGPPVTGRGLGLGLGLGEAPGAAPAGDGSRGSSSYSYSSSGSSSSCPAGIWSRAASVCRTHGCRQGGRVSAHQQECPHVSSRCCVLDVRVSDLTAWSTLPCCCWCCDSCVCCPTLRRVLPVTFSFHGDSVLN